MDLGRKITSRFQEPFRDKSTWDENNVEEDRQSACWRLKENLDQSFQEQQVNTPSYQSDQVSIKRHIIERRASERNSSSLNPSKESQHGNNHFFKLLRQKMQTLTIRSSTPFIKEQKQNNRCQTYSINGKQRYRSASKQKLSLLRSNRKRILNQIECSFSQRGGSNLPNGEEKCPCCDGKGTTKRMSTLGLMKSLIFQLHQTQKTAKFILEPVQMREESAKGRSHKKGMMKKILNMKNQLVARQRTDNTEITEPDYSFKEFSFQKHRRQCQTEPIEADFDSEAGEGSVPVSPFGNNGYWKIQREAGDRIIDTKNENFTFGELSKKDMKMQVQLMKRHMKKVSIQLQQKEPSDKFSPQRLH